MVEAVGNNHKGAVGGDRWELKHLLPVLAELADQCSSADVADLDAMSPLFDNNEQVRMSSQEHRTSKIAESHVAISSSAITQDQTWLHSQLRRHLLRICLLHSQ
jgi:hypothetical protein